MKWLINSIINVINKKPTLKSKNVGLDSVSDNLDEITFETLYRSSTMCKHSLSLVR